MRGMNGLEGRVALITGGGGGIGRAVALRLAREGCAVGILDTDEAGATDAAAAARALGVRAAYAAGSVARSEDVAAAVTSLERALGPTDILVNNAGILRTAPFLEMAEETWHDVFAVNLHGVFNMCRAVLPGMVTRRAGAVVNMASYAGKKGLANHAAYSASKFAVLGMTQSLASEMAQHGIRMNAVCPGIIVDTTMRRQAEALSRAQGLPDLDTRLRTVPMGRGGVPDDIAGVVAFLASDDARYMTGQGINVTGGLWMS